MTSDESRRIAFEGPVNFRDLGGYAAAEGRTVRTRHLFRSDALHALTEADAARFRELGVTTLIDFRSTLELEAGGRAVLDLLDAEHVHLPTFDTTRPIHEDADVLRTLVTAPDAYMSMLAVGAASYAAALRRVSAAEEPLVFFCSAGKDRTGVFAAFVLGLLGVSDDDVVADYALTGDVIALLAERGIFRGLEDSQRAAMDRIGKDLLHAVPESMAVTLERVHARWGDWHGYAASIGVELDAVDALRGRLLV